MVLSFIGLFLGLILLIYLTMRGVNIIVSALICSVILAITGGLSLEEALVGNYMDGFSGFFASWFLIFLLGAIFGKMMEETSAASAIANWVKLRLGAKRAVFAVVAACAVMTYGGVSVYIVAFSVYPIAAALFKSANLPHRFIPAAMVFGSISFTMTSPGSPEVQNLIPTEHFGTSPMAGGWIGFFIAFLIMIVGGFTLGRLVNTAVKNGETYDPPSQVNSLIENNVNKSANGKLPSLLLSLLPLVLVVVVLNVLSVYIETTSAVLIALIVGLLAGVALLSKYGRNYGTMLGKGSENALIATANTAGVIGFGSVAKEVPSFQAIVDILIDMPGKEYVGLALAVTIIAGITGSATGGLGIALPILAPFYMAQGLEPGAMHRISALAAGGLDSLPHNGYVVTTVRAVCNETHQRAYKPIFLLSVIIPTLALILAIIMYSIF